MSGPLLLAATTIAFRGATLIDGTGAPPVPNSLLVISDGRIVSVGLATEEAVTRLPPGTQVITADTKWVLPGFIDAHVHAESEQDLKTMLNWGVTSARLMAEDVAAASALAKTSGARTDIPEVFPAAPIFTAKGGWWDQGQPPDANLNRFPTMPAEARESVRKAKALGAREIKVMLDDMAWCRAPKAPLPKLPPDVVEALIAEARAQGMRATVHAPNAADAKLAIAAGATALAHGVLDPLDDATIAVMKSRPVFYIPTMDIFEFLADTRGFVGGIVARPVEGMLTPETLVRLRSPEYAAGYRERYPNFDGVKRRLPVLRENLRKLHAAGVPVALGTDMWAFPGLAVSVEMDLYVKAGLSPLEVIRAATQTAARSLEIDHDRGTLEPGRRADLLVLRSDPVQGAGHLREIDGIWKNGARVGPTAERRGP
ncbi:MAG: amidohydrolase family protein [Thermoanaerobaculia bacterium]